MSKLVNAIVETYTNGTELYITSDNLDKFATADGWKFVDTLQFHAERKLKREIQDLEFWIPRQSDRKRTRSDGRQSTVHSSMVMRSAPPN